MLKADFLNAPQKHDVTIDWLPIGKLSPFTRAWQELAAHALEPNAFYEPASALAAAQHLDSRHKAHALAVWRSQTGHGQARQLIGLFPMTVSGFGWQLKGWMTPYFAASAPLLHQDAAPLALSALLSFVNRRRPRPLTLLLPELDLDGPLLTTLRPWAQQQGLPLAIINEHHRAMLDLTPEGRRTQANHISSKRRKSLKRRWRRLAQEGRLRHKILTSPEEVQRSVEMFLQLEKAGWKGRAGTAFACREDTAAFAREAYGGAAQHAGISCELLLLDERPLAASITLLSGNNGWAIKAAYDEDFARFAPGLLNDYAMVTARLESQRHLRIDSAAKPGHVLESLWAGRRRTGDVLVGLRPGMSRKALHHYARLQEHKGQIRQQLGQLARFFVNRERR